MLALSPGMNRAHSWWVRLRPAMAHARCSHAAGDVGQVKALPWFVYDEQALAVGVERGGGGGALIGSECCSCLLEDVQPPAGEWLAALRELRSEVESCPLSMLPRLVRRR